MRLLAQLLRFGLVGLLATLVHALIALLLIQFGFGPLLANPLAFLVAFQISYLGHSRWSFNLTKPCRFSHMSRFFIVSIFGILCSQGFLFGLLEFTRLTASISLLIALGISAVCTFFLSRQWAFRELETDTQIN
jgi:putative flippase GtrA